MIELLLDLSVTAGLIFFVLLTIAFCLVTYLIAHLLFRNHLQKEHERVGRVLFRVSASLLAFLLSITFANQRVDYFKIKQSLESEAAKLVDIHLSLELYDTPEARSIDSKILNYVKLVSNEGWKSIQTNPFHSNTVILFKEIYTDIYNLDPTNSFHAKLAADLASDISQMSDYLQVRLYSVRPEYNYLLYTSSFGLFVIMILFSVYSPNKITLIFLGLYVSFIAVVLYFILMMNFPLKGPMQVSGEPFHMLRETIEGRI